MRSLLLPVLAALLLGGCSSGQTGSPDCAPSVSCLCDTLFTAGTPLRVRVERYRDQRLEVVVEEVRPSSYGTNGVVVGDRIGGGIHVAKPCAPEATLEAAEGDELLVLFSPDNQGTPEQALANGYFAWAVPWTDPLAFGAAYELPQAELSVLSDDRSCVQRFPVDPGPPCQDTRSPTCSATTASAEHSREWWLFLAVGTLCAMRRKTKR